MNGYISTGSESFDNFLNGGYEKNVITTIYGPGGSGKSNLCILSAIATIKSGGKVIYIDTESSFSINRFKQIAKEKTKEYLNDIIFLKPHSFAEQKEVIEKLKNNMSESIGLIIIDSIATHYRLEYGKTNEIYSVNRELGLQISYLATIAKKNAVTVLLTNQVYSAFDETDDVKVVGGDVMRYASKAMFELKKAKNNLRAVIIKKHRSLPEGREFIFEITSNGITEMDN